MKPIYALILTAVMQFSFSQQMPIDFAVGTQNFSTFGNSGFSFNQDPEDVNNAVGQFYNDGSDPWQGFYIDLNRPIDLDFQQTISLSFYAFDPNAHTIRLKLENGVNASVDVTQSVASVGWTSNIVFDFSNATISGTSTTVSATGTYNRLTIFIDGGNAILGTYLLDDIDDGSTPTDPNAIDVIYTDLVWADEFDTNGAVDATNWHHQTLLPSSGGWFNGEEQHYTDRIENSFVAAGFLNIAAIKENYTDQGVTKAYTSARLNSKFAFTYGRVDVRAKLPAGDGTWPAIWTLGKNVNEYGGYWNSQFGTVNWPACGEIDIMEHGLGPVNHVSSALHTPCAGCFGNTMNYQSYVLNDVANDFHVYSVNWSPDQITFLIDGVGFYTYNPAEKNDSTWPFDEDQYLLLNIAMGGNAGAIDPNFVQSNMVIDYVRVYQNSGLSLDDAFAQKFSVYPNPATDALHIKTQESIDKVELYNTMGQLVLEQYQTPKVIPIAGFNSGIYILKLYSGNAVAVKKVLLN